MAKIYNTFEFVANLSLPKETDKFKSYEKKEFDSKWVKESLKVNAKIPESSELVTLEDGYYNKSDYGFEKDGVGKKKEDGSYEKGNKIKIAWKDRNNSTILEKVANYQKYILDLSNNKERYDTDKAIKLLEEGSPKDEDIAKIKKDFEIEAETKQEIITYLKETLKKLNESKHEFLSRVDMIAKLKEILNTPEGTNTVFKITGNINYSEWNGKVYRTFQVNKIEKAVKGEKLRLNGQLDIYFNQQSLDESLFEDTKKYYLNAWTKTYDGQLKQEIYVPITLIADGSRLDLSNEKHLKRLEGLVKRFRVNDDETIYQFSYEVKFANGSERVEITMDDLSDIQKEYIEDGIMTFEEAVMELGGNKFGDRVNETRLFKPAHIKDFPDGAMETDLKLEDFIIEREDNKKTEDTDDETVNEEEPSEDDELDDLI